MNLALLVRRPASAKFKLPRGRASKRGLNEMGKDPGDCLQVATTFVGQTRGVGGRRNSVMLRREWDFRAPPFELVAKASGPPSARGSAS